MSLLICESTPALRQSFRPMRLDATGRAICGADDDVRQSDAFVRPALLRRSDPGRGLAVACRRRRCHRIVMLFAVRYVPLWDLATICGGAANRSLSERRVSASDAHPGIISYARTNTMNSRPRAYDAWLTLKPVAPVVGCVAALVSCRFDVSSPRPCVPFCNKTFGGPVAISSRQCQQR